MADARYALEVAAAGGHHLLLSGPKGAGKTTLAERLPGLLPDLAVDEALELSAIHSLAGGLPPGRALVTRPPFRAPHHSATRASVLGGGTGRVHPGEVSRAHHGTLFLDEFPLFQADIVDGLREPLESGEVTIARGEESATFPARCLVVLACNPCPCGDYHPSATESLCTCPETSPPALPPQADRPGDRPHRHQPARRCPCGRTRPTTRWPGRRPRRRCGPGWPRRASGSAALRGRPRGGSTPTSRGRCSGRPGRSRRPRRGASTRGCTTAASPAAAPPGSTGWPGPWPTWPASSRRGSRSWTPRCGCAPASRCCWPSLAAGAGA